MSDAPASTTINIPQLAILLLVGVLVVRWFFSASTPPNNRNASRSANGGSSSSRQAAASRITPAQVELVAGMFPQLSQRDILWDLQRNGGNMQMTTERILNGRGLEVPPPTFQPPMLAVATSESGAAARRATVEGKKGPDLIQRYNLDSKTETETADMGETSGESTPTKIAWSTNKTDRQSLLQKRREEMILAARRKMMESAKDK